LPSPEIDTLSLSMSRCEEQSFIRGCHALIKGHEERARMEFRTATRQAGDFMEAWFMVGFMELLNQRAERAMQAFLRILREESPFGGIYILRFMPTFRPCVNLFEDFLFHIMPTTPEVAAVAARLYLVEGRVREAKKIIHPAFREYPTNTAVRVVWAQTMLADGAPRAIIDDIDRRINFHQGKSDLDVLLTYLIGQAYFELNDFRSAVAHMESVLHNAHGKNPRLMDRFKVGMAKVYEAKKYLIDVFDILNTVEDPSVPYEKDVTVDFKRGQIVEKIETYRRQGIKLPLEFEYSHEYKKARRTEGYLELDGAGGGG